MSRPPHRITRRLAGKPTRSHATLLVVALAALALLLPLTMTTDSPNGSAAFAASTGEAPAPLLYGRGFADPTVVESRVGMVGAATALNLNIGRAPSDAGPWNVIASPALTRRPGWATSEDIWAPDIQRAPAGWLMYYAAEVTGAADGSRCIGVAYSKSAFGPYTPIGSAPLVCPLVPGVPRAADISPSNGRHAGPRGVIDPSSFIGNNGQRFLVYRTQGTPSSIRLVRLSQRGRRIQEGQTSSYLTTNSGIEENPVIVRHDDKWVMFTSVGWFGHCAYRTYWRRSSDFRDWSRATPKLLLSRDNGLCGPGGADVVQRRDGRTQLYFHAWTCYRGPYPCPDDWNKNTPKKRHGVRAMYGANLLWTLAGRPRIESWIAGVLPPPPPPPTPTPTPTPSPTPTPTPTPTPSPTVSPTVSPSTPTDSPTVTETATGTGAPSPIVRP